MNRFIYRIIHIWENKRNSNTRYAWYVTRKKRFHILSGILSPKYACPGRIIPQETKIVICPYEGKLEGGGLADRLRGIISVYYICKKLSIDFKIVFNYPFKLEDYLEPNKYDWRDGNNILRYDIPNENILIVDTTQDSTYQKEQQLKWLYKHISKRKGQIHVYTNAAFSYDNGYKELFHELFKPTFKLQMAINNQLAKLGSKYISVSCRFLNLLGDFNETHGYTSVLTDDEKEDLILSVIDQVKLLHQKYPEYKILCNSDSITFLHRVSYLSYTYVIPGEITHIDERDSHGDYYKYEKTFLDFFMIANAQYIYILKTGRMHKSGYPYAASFVFNRPFRIVQF